VAVIGDALVASRVGLTRLGREDTNPKVGRMVAGLVAQSPGRPAQGSSTRPSGQQDARGGTAGADRPFRSASTSTSRSTISVSRRKGPGGDPGRHSERIHRGGARSRTFCVISFPKRGIDEEYDRSRGTGCRDLPNPGAGRWRATR